MGERRDQHAEHDHRINAKDAREVKPDRRMGNVLRAVLQRNTQHKAADDKEHHQGRVAW